MTAIPGVERLAFALHDAKARVSKRCVDLLREPGHLAPVSLLVQPVELREDPVEYSAEARHFDCDVDE